MPKKAFGVAQTLQVYFSPKYLISAHHETPKHLPIRNRDLQIVYPEPDFNPDLEVYCVPLDFRIEAMGAEEAMKVIEDLMEEFCFKDYDSQNPDPNHCQSRVHMLARLITPYCRGIMGFECPSPFIHLPRQPAPRRQRLRQRHRSNHLPGAQLRRCADRRSKRNRTAHMTYGESGRREVHWANCQHTVDDPNFIQTQTSRTINGRRLGSNTAESDRILPNEVQHSLSLNTSTGFREDVPPGPV